KEGAVDVVAVGALDQAFVHLVMYRHAELRLLISVALVAERWLRRLEQLFFLTAVDIVAADATHVGLAMRRAVEVWVRSRVAALALRVQIFSRSLGGVEDLDDVGSIIGPGYRVYFLRRGVCDPFQTS